MRLILALAVFPAPLFAQAISGGEQVIRQQIDAFRAGDFSTAFGFASDNIKGIFGTAENFGAMVSGGYPDVLNPAEIAVLSERPEGAATWLRVMLTGEGGTVTLYNYEIIETPDGPRINAVVRIPAPDVAA
jgi:hypothetical protein